MNAASALVRWVDGWTGRGGRLSEHPLCYRPLMYCEHQAQSNAAPRLPQQRTGGALVLPSQGRQLSAEKLGWNPPEREQFRLLGLGTGQETGVGAEVPWAEPPPRVCDAPWLPRTLSGVGDQARC